MIKPQAVLFWSSFTPKIVTVWRASPNQGLITAVIAGFLISALGGLTGAFVVMVAGIIAAHGYAGPYIDSTSASALEAFVRQAQIHGTPLILCDLKKQPNDCLDKLWDRFVGAERVPSFQAALNHALESRAS